MRRKIYFNHFALTGKNVAFSRETLHSLTDPQWVHHHLDSHRDHWKTTGTSWALTIWLCRGELLFQWFCFSVERYERRHQLQETIPQHCGESTTGRQSEWVLLKICKNTPDPPWTLLNTTPLPPHLQFRSVKTRCARSSGSTKGKKHQAKTVLHQPVCNLVLTSWPPSSQRYSTDHWDFAKSLHTSNAAPSSPSQINPKLQH